MKVGINVDMRAFVLRLVASAVVMLAASPSGAGRFCSDSVEGGVAAGATEEAAREAATAWWSSRAGSLGKGYEDWQSAEKKAFTCERSADGAWKCKAAGKPCLPDGVMPENVPKFDL